MFIEVKDGDKAMLIALHTIIRIEKENGDAAMVTYHFKDYFTDNEGEQGLLATETYEEIKLRLGLK